VRAVRAGTKRPPKSEKVPLMEKKIAR